MLFSTTNSLKRKFDENDSDELPDDARPSSAAETLSAMPDRKSELCARCKEIDFGKVSHLQIKTKLGVPVVKLGPVETLTTSSCPLCQLFGSSSSLTRAKDGGKNSKNLYLRAFSSNSVFARLPTQTLKSHGGDGILLGVLDMKPAEVNDGRYDAFAKISDSLKQSGYLCLTDFGKPSTAAFTVRTRSSDCFDADIARNWLQYCRKNHGKNCVKTRSRPMTSLRLIDCISRTIVDAPTDCEYVALSYVWGSSLPTCTTADRKDLSVGILPTLPKTIEDSIRLTRNLHLRYLWVDKYCIDQANLEDKHHQIRQMDLIYSAATVSIIAAAGESPHHGLPGINGTDRTKQQLLRNGDYLIAQTMTHPSHLLRKSAWASRGWTYQEGILSNRRLILADQQAFYECGTMHCNELVQCPIDAMHTKRGDRLKAHVPLGSFEVKLPGSAPFDIFQYISEFYRRELSYSGDALIAMRGIFNSFEQGPYAVNNLSGIPIFPPLVFQLGTGKPRSSAKLAKENFVAALIWFHCEGGGRRTQFPSWSWAGWVGGQLSPVTLDHENMLRTETTRTKSACEDYKVWIEESDGRIHPFPEYEGLADYLSSMTHHANFIHIEAWTLNCSIVYPVRSSRKAKTFGMQSTAYVKLAMENTRFGLVDFKPCMHTSLANQEVMDALEKTYIGIMIPHCYRFPQAETASVLVVEDHGDYYERVGCFRLDRFNERLYCEVYEELILEAPATKRPPQSQDYEDMYNLFGKMPKERRAIRLP